MHFETVLLYLQLTTTNTGWGKSRFDVCVSLQNTVYSHLLLLYIFHTNNYKPTFALPCITSLVYINCFETPYVCLNE